MNRSNIYEQGRKARQNILSNLTTPHHVHLTAALDQNSFHQTSSACFLEFALLAAVAAATSAAAGIAVVAVAAAFAWESHIHTACPV